MKLEDKILLKYTSKEDLLNAFLENKCKEGLVNKYAHVSKVFTSNEGTLLSEV